MDPHNPRFSQRERDAQQRKAWKERVKAQREAVRKQAELELAASTPRRWRNYQKKLAAAAAAKQEPDQWSEDLEQPFAHDPVIVPTPRPVDLAARGPSPHAEIVPFRPGHPPLVLNEDGDPNGASLVPFLQRVADSVFIRQLTRDVHLTQLGNLPDTQQGEILRRDWPGRPAFRIPLRLTPLIQLDPEEVIDILKGELGIVLIACRNHPEHIARVDREDAHDIRQFTWFPVPHNHDFEMRTQRQKNGIVYETNIPRRIMDARRLERVRILDGDPRNCTRRNLRLFASAYEPIGSNPLIGYRAGIEFNPTTQVWNVARARGREIPGVRDLGGWPTQELAILAYHADVALVDIFEVSL